MPDDRLIAATGLIGPWPIPPSHAQVAEIFHAFMAARSTRVIPGYSRTLASKRLVPAPLFRFDTNDGKTKRFYCSTCNTPNKFGAGVAVWHEDGWIRLIGCKCGAEFYEHTDFAARIDEMDRLAKRRDRLASFPAILLAAREVRRDINALCASSLLSEMGRFRISLEKKAQALYHELHYSVTNGNGNLVISRKLTQPKNIGGRRVTHEDFPFAAFRGHRILRHDVALRNSLDSALSILLENHILLSGGKAADVDDRRQQKAVGRYREAEITLRQAKDHLENALAFFGSTNRTVIAKWATENPNINGRLRATRAGWVWSGDHDDVTFDVAELMPRPILPSLDALTRALKPQL
ncbi:MAG TPA: hypothetical protein VKQ27_07070 [Acetobacteraceae bacterium]|nr:hypothetical protein [Acetobacteraceae bacterium]